VGLRALVLLAGAAGVLCATSGVWQTKDFKDWTEKDARLILTDSPWAKPMPLPAGARPNVQTLDPGVNGVGPPTASLGNPPGTTMGTSMGNSPEPGSTGQPDPGGTQRLPVTPTPSGIKTTGAPPEQAPLIIIWASAIPVRLAVLKLRLEANATTLTDEQISKAKSPRPNYVIAVTGLPAPDRDVDPKALASNAFLNVRGKAPLRATDSDYRRIGNSDVYFFRFPRASLPISASDRDVEFKMTMGQVEIKRKFELKEMQYQGELAL